MTYIETLSGWIGSRDKELSRRVDTVIRLNLLGDRLAAVETELTGAPFKSPEWKSLTAKRKRIAREIDGIKADEAGWLKKFAKFLY